MLSLHWNHVERWHNKANLRDLIAADGLVILLKLDSNLRFFSPWELEIWWMTPKNNKAPLLYYIKLCASFHIHRWIQIRVIVQKRSIRRIFLSHVILKFDRWLWKTIRHLFCDTFSFMRHFKAIREFKLELQSGNTQFGSKSAIFLSHVTLKFDGGPSKITGHLFYTTWSIVHHFKAMGEFKLALQYGNAQFGSKSMFFVPCDLEIWQRTLKNNKAPFLCNFKLCALFHSHLWIEIGVTVWKRSICVKIEIFLAVWPWNLTDDLEKQ